MTHFLRNGNVVRLTNDKSVSVTDSLPVGNYIIKINSFTGEFFLEEVDSFEEPTKVYGEQPKQIDRVFNTFMNRPNSTGVLLSGEAGSGKTMLARGVSILGAKHGVPTLIINEAMSGEAFNQFIQSINQPCIVLFDEFEKVFDNKNQQQLLTLLDGVFPSKKLFILTCNDKYRIDAHMHNRPGRIFYAFDFDGVSESFIRDYCEDNLINKKYIDNVCIIAAAFSKFTVDMVKALVEEMNRYDESPVDAIRGLNIKAETASSTKYEVSIVSETKPVIRYTNGPLDINPLNLKQLYISYQVETVDEDGETETDHCSTYINSDDIIKFDRVNGEFAFRSEDEDGEPMIIKMRRKVRSGGSFIDEFLMGHDVK